MEKTKEICIKIDAQVEGLYNKIKLFFIGKVFIKLISEIVLALLIAVFTYLATSFYHNRTAELETNKKLEQIYVSVSDEYVNALFGSPSPGWKEDFANEQYCEGKEFHAFEFMGRRIVVGLCGDLWFDDNIMKIKALYPEVVLWPVYTDFNYNEWNESMKYEYADQVGKIGGKVLYINSFCKDKDEVEIARGGSVLFVDGKIDQEIPSGKEDILVVEV